MQRRPRVILFKTPLESDPYSETLGSEYEVAFIPVLQETYGLEELKTVLKGGGGGWEAVVVSSKRGAGGYLAAAAAAEGEAESQRSIDHGDWSSTPLFVVGDSTLSTLASAPNAHRHLLPDLASAVVGKNASELVPLLVNRPPRNSGHGAYLVIRGDKSTEEVQTALRAAGREVVEVVVYQTSQRPELETALRTALPEIYPAQPNGLSSQLKPSTTPPAPWLAFFSPSSAGMVLDLLVGSAGIRVFAIGETTRKYLLSRGVRVDAVANEPTALGMLEALRRAEELS